MAEKICFAIFYYVHEVERLVVFLMICIDIALILLHDY